VLQKILLCVRIKIRGLEIFRVVDFNLKSLEWWSGGVVEWWSGGYDLGDECK
jgi:hypothetical protein